MSSIEITDDQHDRLIALREEIATTHADSYTSVTLPDTVAYLLDLADTVDDPDREADSEALVSAVDDAADTDSDASDDRLFPREQLETRLRKRNRRHSEADPDEPMDLYSIATAYDIRGRSTMTKPELVTAILDVVERRYTDPLGPVDIDLPDPDGDVDATDADAGDDSDTTAGNDTDTAGDDSDMTVDDGNSGSDADSDGGDDGQLNAMLNLLDTHGDKWRSADGDARYEVDLPDGSVESARTKDDVRATLFKHY